MLLTCRLKFWSIARCEIPKGMIDEATDVASIAVERKNDISLKYFDTLISRTWMIKSIRFFKFANFEVEK